MRTDTLAMCIARSIRAEVDSFSSSSWTCLFFDSTRVQPSLGQSCGLALGQMIASPIPISIEGFDFYRG